MLLHRAAVLCAFLAVAHCFFVAYDYDYTYDEKFHLNWSERFLETGETERLSSTNFDSKTPFTVPNAVVRKFVREHFPRCNKCERYWGRVVTIVWFVTLLVFSYIVLRRALNPECADLALLFLSLDPNFVAHSAITTVDIGFALGTVFTLTAYAWFWKKSGLLSAIAVGAALGFAITAKFSAVLLFPLFFAPPLVGLRAKQLRLLKLLSFMSVSAFVFWLTVCSTYGFHGLWESSTFDWNTEIFQVLRARLPVLVDLFPVNFLSGIDISQFKDQSIEWNSYLFDTQYPNGVWYYFLVTWFYKTPISLLVLTLIGFFFLFSDIRRRPESRFLFLSFLLLFVYFSVCFRTQVGYRYTLMCLPIAYALAALGLCALVRKQYFTPTMLVATCFALVEQLPYFGNPLSFTNSFLWNKKNAYQVLADSNLNFGQYDDRIREYVLSSPHPIFLNPVQPQVGENIFDINHYVGVFYSQYRAGMRLKREPDSLLWHTHLVFNVGKEEFETLRHEQWALSGESEGQKYCDLSEPLSANGSQILDPPFSEGFCVQAASKTFVKFEILNGALIFAHNNKVQYYTANDKDIYNRSFRYPYLLSVELQPGIFPFLSIPNSQWKVSTGNADVAIYPLKRAEERFSKLIVPTECKGGMKLIDAGGSAVPLYVRGNWNNWLPYESGRLTFSDGCYKAEIEIPQREHLLRLYEPVTELKIADSEWSDEATIGSPIATNSIRGPFGNVRVWNEALSELRVHKLAERGNIIFPSLEGKTWNFFFRYDGNGHGRLIVNKAIVK